jgi:hypothetical protein
MWPPNSSDINPIGYRVWGAIQERYKVLTPKPTDRDEIKTVLAAGGNLGRLASRGYQPGCASIPEETTGNHLVNLNIYPNKIGSNNKITLSIGTN